MITPTNLAEGGEPDLDALFRCLASSDQRWLLGKLYERDPAPLTPRDLATYLVPEYQENPVEVGSSERVRQTYLSLQHTHLPELEAAGLIDLDSTRGRVTIADHPAFADAGIVDAIGDSANGDSDSLDALFAALAHPRRRTILDVLSHQFGPIHIETLAREIGAEERSVEEADVPAADVERILGALYHSDLPRLSDADLIEYDPAGRTVAYGGHPDLRVPWMHSVLEPAFRQSLTGESDPNGIGEIRGREEVVSFGQSLCDRVDEELFCMFTATDLLEAGCFARLRDAARRGVDVYLGTRDPTVRQYVQEHAPEVVLWEPNTNWLNVPVAGGRVGRLLLADREAVMIGTLVEETTDGVHEEQAIIGEGANDTLVTMICQLLVPHLETIDDETEDVAFELPF